MRHQNLDEQIARLAEDLDLPVESVKTAYLEILRDLTVGARVHDYLHVFVVKHVMAQLRSTNRPDG
jgi:hypothetical protein